MRDTKSLKAPKGHALITGASQGLGRAIALELAGEGYGVVLVARSADKLKDVATLCRELNGGRAMLIEMDLTRPDAVNGILSSLEPIKDSLEILVNNAGEAVWGYFSEMPLADHLRMMRLNMFAPVELTHRLIPLFRKNRKGYILNIGSMTGYNAMATFSTYSGSKSFLLRWSRSLRMEMKEKGISVTCVCPGSVLTGFTERAGMQVMDDLAARFGSPPEPIARASVRAMFAGKAEYVPGILDGITAKLMGLLPTAMVERISSAIYLKKLPHR